MREYTVTIDKLPQAWRTELRRNKEILRESVTETMFWAIHILQQASPIDWGTFRESWTWFEENPDTYILTNDCPYAEYIEEGTRPHWPPPEPIRDWILRNEDKLHGFPINAKEGTTALNQVTYLISRKISQEGTRPHHILKNRQGVITRQLQKIVERRLNE